MPAAALHGSLARILAVGTHHALLGRSLLLYCLQDNS
jgi:hypothetical protein